MYSACFTHDWKNPSSEVRHGFKTKTAAEFELLKEAERSGFKSHYQIHTKQSDGSEIIDYGSHSTFIMVRKEV